MKAKAAYEQVFQERDGVALLSLIKQTTFTYDSTRLYTAVTRDRLKEEFYGLRRKQNQSLQSYYEVFRAKYKVLEELNIKLYDEDFVEEIMKAKSKTRTTPNEIDKTTAQDRCVAVRFIRTCGEKDYESHLQNSFLDGSNHYPATLADAFAIIDNRMHGNRQAQGQGRHNQDSQGTGVAYHTRESDDNTLTGTTLTTTTTTCQEQTPDGNNGAEDSGAGSTNTGNRGHSYVPSVTFHNEHESSISPAFSFTSTSLQGAVPPNWVLLDNQSTVDIIANPSILKNIHTSEQPILISSHAGSRELNQQALLPGYGLVWFDPEGPANILSLHLAKARFSIHYDSVNGNSFKLYDPSSGRLKHTYNQSPEGLFFLDVNQLHHGSFLTTVKENEESFTPQEVSRAKLARRIQGQIGRPATREFIKIVEGNLLPNVPINSQDIRRAEKLYGPDLGSRKGKTVRRKSPIVDTEQAIPPPILLEHQDVTMAMDVMHVNGIPFLLATTLKIQFGTVDALPRLNEDTLMASIKKTVAILRRGGLRPRMLLFDGALGYDGFEQRLAMLGVKLNTTAQDEHVGAAERYIRTVKDRMRSTYAMLPFKTVPRIMIIELAKFAVFWLNSFPKQNGISQTISPRELVTGEKIDFHHHCRFEFGQYVQTHEQHDNTMAPRTIGAIALRPTGNRQGSYYFVSLESGRVINRNRATVLPMPNEVSKRVEEFAQAQNMIPGLAFGNRDSRLLAMDEDNPLYIKDDDVSYGPNDDDKSVDELRYDDEIVEEELADLDEELDQHPEFDENQGVAAAEQYVIGNEGVVVPDGVELVLDGDMNGPEEEGGPAEGEALEEEVDEDVDDAHVADMMDEGPVEELNNIEVPINLSDESMEIEFGTDAGSEAEGGLFENAFDEQQQERDPQSHEYNLRPNRQRSYAYRFGHNFVSLDTLPKGRYDGYLHKGTVYLTSTEVNQSTPQYPMKYGLKLFGNKGVEAVRKEIQQLHDRGVVRAVHRSELSWPQVRAALGYLMFLQRKRCGKIKGRGCADGRKQRLFIPKEDSASPTVSTDAVFYTAIIDAIERRAVAVIDIPGAFMHSDMDPNVHMKLEGLMAELLLEIDPVAYKPYVTYEKGKPVIYMEMLKALYGTLRAARLFWERLSGVLVSWGFVINPYDSCVANKWIDGAQCTITWHIDDLKISHVKEDVLTKIIEDLKAEFGRLGELSVSRGRRHDYLGMYLDYSEDRVLEVDMRPYLATILDDLPKAMKGKAQSPAANHLTMIRENVTKLSTKEAEEYHSRTMQLSYLAQRGRPDIRTAVAFLSTQVASPDVDNKRKLTRVLKYLQSSFDLTLRLEADPDGILKWWADASYATHADSKGLSGGCMSMGRGVAHSVSTKQKLVSRSSTESELIGIHNVLPSLLWSRNFLEAQGMKVKDVILFQDNKSAILLANNGRLSSSKRTKHINVRYFFVKDQIEKKLLRTEFCPTDEMLADFFTKPLQGTLFYKLRDAVMNIRSDSPFHSSQRSVLGPVDEQTNSEAKDEDEDESATKAVEEKWIVVERRGNEKKERSMNAHSKENTLT